MKSKIFALLTGMALVASLALAQDAAVPAAAPAAAPAVAPAAAPAAKPAVTETKAPAMMPLEMRKVGVVNVIKDSSGKTTAIKLNVISYDIQLDEGSKPLEAMDGQKVRISCTLNHEGGKRILTVKTIEPAEGGTTPVAPAAEKPVEAPAPLEK